jgi:hypothetical protein
LETWQWLFNSLWCFCNNWQVISYNRIGGVMVRVFTSSEVDHGFEPQSGKSESIRTRSDNPDQMTLNKQSIVLYGHYLSVPKVTIKYKFDCNLYVQPKDKICLYYFDLTFYLWHILFKIFFTIFYLTNSQTWLHLIWKIYYYELVTGMDFGNDMF